MPIIGNNRHEASVRDACGPYGFLVVRHRELTLFSIPNGDSLPVREWVSIRRSVMLTVVEQTLSNVLLFTLDVRLISGSKRVRPEDIEAAKNVQLEADEVFTLGSKKVFDPERLAIFKRLKERMHRECLRFGTAWLTGYAVPESKVDDVAAALEVIRKDADKEVADLLKNYQSYLDDFCAANPAWAESIRANAYTEQYIRQRLHFGFNATRVLPARSEGLLAKNLQQEVGGLLGAVLRDVAEEAESLQKRSLTGKDQKTRKVLSPLRAAHSKLLGFAFLDRRVVAVAAMIESFLTSMPGDGPIEGTSLAMLWAITTILSDPVRTLEVAEQFDTHGKDAFLGALMPRAGTKPAPAQPAAAPMQPPPSPTVTQAAPLFAALKVANPIVQVVAAPPAAGKPATSTVVNMPPPTRRSGFAQILGGRK